MCVCVEGKREGGREEERDERESGYVRMVCDLVYTHKIRAYVHARVHVIIMHERALSLIQQDSSLTLVQ